MGKMAMWLSVMRTLSIGMIAALVLTGTAMGEISRTGLVAEWHFEGDVKDSSGNGIDGTIINDATFVDGKFGKTLNFDGINDYVDFGTGRSKLDFGRGDFSIEFWMNYKGTTVHPNATTIMEKRSEETGNPGFMAWTTTWGGDGSNYGLFIATSTASWGNGNAEDWGKYSPNKWYHVVFVRTEDTWTIYKDGAYSASSTKDGIGLNVNNDASFKIGVTGTSSPYFKGLIDEVRIYNRALSENEVKANYEAGQIIITSIPPGAEVQVDGTSIGIASTNLVYTVTPAIHNVKCKLAGYSDEERTVTVTPSSATAVTCSLKTPTSPSSEDDGLMSSIPGKNITDGKNTEGDGNGEVPEKPYNAFFSENVIIALITALATIITAYFGYRAVKKKE